jgi:hypothetical protein
MMSAERRAMSTHVLMGSYALRSLSNLMFRRAHIRVARMVGLSRSHARRLKFCLTRWPKPTAIAIPFRPSTSGNFVTLLALYTVIGGSSPESRPVPTRFHAVRPHGQR